MKKILVILLFVFPLVTLGQSAFLEKAKNRAKNKAEQRALNKIDKETDKALDEIENGSSSEKSTEKTRDENKNEKSVSENSDIKAYSKYDFVPGEKIVYAVDFARMKLVNFR